MTRRWGAAAVLATLLACASTAAPPSAGAPPPDAGAAKFDDPNDTIGPLDIQQVTHQLNGGYLTFQVATFEPWDLADLKKNWFAIPINVLSDDPDHSQKDFGSSYNYVASVTAGPYRMRAEVWDHDAPDPKFVGDMTTRRAGSRKLILTFPESYLASPGPYKWNLGSLYKTRRGCGEDRTCRDWTTGRGFFDLGATQQR